MTNFKLSALLFAFSFTVSSCLDLDEEKREREAEFGPDSLVKPYTSPYDTAFRLDIKNDQLFVMGAPGFGYNISWAQVDTLLRQTLEKRPWVEVVVSEFGSDPKMVDTAEDILIRNGVEEYMRFTNPKYPVYSKKFIEKKP